MLGGFCGDFGKYYCYCRYEVVWVFRVVGLFLGGVYGGFVFVFGEGVYYLI